MPGLEILGHLYLFFTRVFTRISLESLELRKIAQVPGNRPKVGQNQIARSLVSANFWSLSGYISARLLITKRSNIFSVHYSENQSLLKLV